MFEAAELGHEISKEEYDKREPEVREALLSAQFDLLEAKKFSVLVLVGGVDGGGKGDIANLLVEWLDPRYVDVHALPLPRGEDAERPPYYRFWKVLPPKGRMAVFVGSWYTQPILSRAYRETSRAELDQSIRRIAHFERMLANEGVVFLKIWLHLTKKEQRRRLERLEKSEKTSWRVTQRDWDHHELYDRFRTISERTLRGTSTAEAPWLVVESSDNRYRNLTVASALASAVRRRLDEPAPTKLVHAPPLPAPIDGKRVLDVVDTSKSLDKAEAQDRLLRAQGELNKLFRSPEMAQRSVVLVFEGMDAAGKGGAIRRVTGALDARQYRVVPIAAPTDEERARPYIWRFWRHLPGWASMTIFDRSWYGRVLVERLEGFCDTDDWMRAYGEINDFEEQLIEGGVVVVKFWLQISAEEQLRRFQEREKTGFKRHKITPEDWRNREKWDNYQLAASEMIERTSTEIAPWTIVEANDKNFARAKVLDTTVERIRAALG